MKKYSIAIIGAGPSGYFAAQALQNLANDETGFAIDMFERLPTPWGLVRSGVAPDHPKIKSVSKVFEKIATTEGFRLFANVELGKDVTLTDLQDRYDAVVIATGSSKGKRLGIPGEELQGSLSAAEFVPWYNGHPDFADLNPDLSSNTAVVIGAGNVAMDVARMLAVEPSDLDSTDTADHAIEALKKSAIRSVVISARRGPENAAFTSPELRELPHLEHTNVVISAQEIESALAREGEAIEKDTKSNLDAMLSIAQAESKHHDRTMRFQFHATPVAIKGNGKVEEIVFKKTGTDEEFSIPCGLVVTAIGYEATGIDGVEFSQGKIVNSEGHIANNLYVVGWAKRGPSGVIGTNKSDAAEVMRLLVSHLDAPKASTDIADQLSSAMVVTQSDWEKINAAEVAAGEPLGKPRKKAVSREELLNLGGLS